MSTFDKYAIIYCFGTWAVITLRMCLTYREHIGFYTEEQKFSEIFIPPKYVILFEILFSPLIIPIDVVLGVYDFFASRSEDKNSN